MRMLVQLDRVGDEWLATIAEPPPTEFFVCNGRDVNPFYAIVKAVAKLELDEEEQT